MAKFPNNCVFIGAGNVAWSLVPAFQEIGIEILQIYSRNIENAKAISRRTTNACPIDDLSQIQKDADLYVVCTADNAIPLLINKLQHIGGLWIHTSGGVNINVLNKLTNTYGGLYPLQTFTKGLQISLSDVPLFISGNSYDTILTISSIAKKLSGKVFEADHTTLVRIHSAAVFACNFVNYMWINANEILAPIDQDISLLFPLIGETWRKIHHVSPLEAQTGPARRGDTEVMERHLKILDDEKQSLYKLLSDSIMKKFDIDKKI